MDFRVHLSTVVDANAVTNLITGIGDVRDTENAETAHKLLDRLIDEIAFVRRYILNDGHSARDSIVVRADALAATVLADSVKFDRNYVPVDIRSNATGTAIHP